MVVVAEFVDTFAEIKLEALRSLLTAATDARREASDTLLGPDGHLGPAFFGVVQVDTLIAELDKLVVALNAQNEAYWAHVVGAQRVSVSAWVAHHEGRHEDALRLALEAADTEEKVEKHPVTPGPLIPARELYGDILMLHGRPADALLAYETTLKREPNRLRTLYGAARAASSAKQPDVARRYYEEIVKLVDAKSDRPALKEASAFLAQK